MDNTPETVEIVVTAQNKLTAALERARAAQAACAVTLNDVRHAQAEAVAAMRARGEAPHASGLNWADLGPSPAALDAQARCLLRDAIGRARDIADPIDFARTAIDLARAVHDLPAPRKLKGPSERKLTAAIEKAMTDGGPLFFDRAADKA